MYRQEGKGGQKVFHNILPNIYRPYKTTVKYDLQYPDSKKGTTLITQPSFFLGDAANPPRLAIFFMRSPILARAVFPKHTFLSIAAITEQCHT
jgi:hypothetical protein